MTTSGTTLTKNSTPKELQIYSPTLLSRLVSHLASDIPGFHSIIASKYFQRKLVDYEDVNGKTKLALSFIFVQDNNAPIENLDRKVFDSLTSLLEKMKLTLIVNDVVVNLLHSRDGKEIL